MDTLGASPAPAAACTWPFLFATGPGAEIQRPLAVVVIGGLITATALTLVLLPVLHARFALPRQERQAHAGRELPATPAE